MPERGVVTNPARAGQIRDFSDLLIGSTITPTDLDALIEYHNERFVFAETKLEGVPVLVLGGQLLALGRLCDACERGGKPSILFITNHNTPPECVIRMGLTVVDSYRYKFNWYKQKGNGLNKLLLRDAVRHFVENQQCPHEYQDKRLPTATTRHAAPINILKQKGVHLAQPDACFTYCGQRLFEIASNYKTRAPVTCFKCKGYQARIIEFIGKQG